MTGSDPNNEASYCSCVIPSDLKETTVAKTAILTELDRRGYSEEDKFAIKLALEEALTNAVKHGNRGDARKSIRVRYAVSDEKAVVIVRDEGPGFIPEKVPDCTCPDRLPIPNGRGIMLIKAYMDEVCYRDQGREVFFVKRRASRGSAAFGCPATIRRTTCFSGRVQGVGFRAATVALAEKFKVTGFVRNVPDGRVELVVEGSEVEVDRFETAVEQAMKGHILDTQSYDAPAVGDLRGFSIRR